VPYSGCDGNLDKKRGKSARFRTHVKDWHIGIRSSPGRQKTRRMLEKSARRSFPKLPVSVRLRLLKIEMLF
jgi:hypothetical protein